MVSNHRLKDVRAQIKKSNRLHHSEFSQNYDNNSGNSIVLPVYHSTTCLRVMLKGNIDEGDEVILLFANC